jgi:sugar phosphate isomerase/epimerase
MKNLNQMMFASIIMTSTFIFGSVSDSQAAQNLMSVWNQRVDPTQHPLANARITPPVNWGDFKDHITVAPTLSMGRKQTGDFSYDINLDSLIASDRYLRYCGFRDRIYSISTDFAFAGNYKDVIDWWAKNNVSVIAQGIGSWTVDGWFSNPYPGFGDGVPAEVHKYVLEKLENKFFGWVFTEEDDRYNIVTAWYMPETPVSRKDGYRNFMGLCRQVSKRNSDYMATICNTVWAPYMAEMDATRIFGIQTPEAKYNVQLWSSMVRGASRQYGVLWYPCFTTCNGPLGQSRNFDHKELQTAGNSMSLMKRASRLSYLYGASFMSMGDPVAMAPYDKKVTFEGETLTVGQPSPFSDLEVGLADWMKRHPDKGVMHTPAALIWDFYAGWQPPRQHGNNWKPFTVWGSMPYEKGDHQIDMTFRMLFPGCSDAAFSLDEKGFLTNTPCGDIFDVLLSNVSGYVLNQYNAAVVLGPTKIEGPLKDTLQEFINRGGSVATTVSQLTDDSAEMFGIRLTGEKLEKEHYVQILDGGEKPGKAVFRDFTEHEYTLHKIVPASGTEIIASNWEGDPVAVRRKTSAGGELLVFASDYGMSNWIGPKPLKWPQYNQPAAAPYRTLQHVEAILKPWLRKWNLVDIQGPEVQYLTNVTDRPDRFIVTLINNEADYWNGRFGIKNATVVSANDWVTEKELNPGKFVELTIKPHDMAVIEVRTDNPVVSFKTRKDLPQLNKKEKHSIADETIADLAAYSPQGMLKMELPDLPKQNSEPDSATYVNAWLFEGKDPAQWVPELKALGLSGVEVKATDFYRPQMKELWGLLKENGLRVGAIHAGVDMQPFNFGTLSSSDKNFREPVLQWLEKTMGQMKKAGIDRLVLYTGYKREHRYLQTLKHDGSEYLPSLKRLAKTAETLGLTLVVEGADHQQCRRDSELIELVNQVNSPAVAAGMDIGSSALFKANYKNELKIEYTMRNIGFAIPIETIYMQVAEDWRSDIWRLKDVDIDAVYDDSVLKTGPVDAVEAYDNLVNSGKLKYVHISNFKQYSNGLYQNTHVALTEGIVPLDVYKAILSKWSKQSGVTCLYLLDSEQPMETLRKSVAALKK